MKTNLLRRMSMSIRSIDLQVMIPKTPEVQKAKSVEAENPINNNFINIQKEQQASKDKLKQVYGKDKAEGNKVDREKQNKNQNRNRDQNQEREKKKNKTGFRIDIKI
jgi:hypothetical protein